MKPLLARTLLALAIAVFSPGCVNIPVERTYSISSTGKDGRNYSAGVTLRPPAPTPAPKPAAPPAP